MPINKIPTTAPNVLNATATPRPIDVFNQIWDKAGDTYRDNVPKLSAKDSSLNFLPVGQSILNGSPAVRNAFLTNLFEGFVLGRALALMFHTPYAPLKKGVVSTGGILTHTWTDLITPDPYNLDPYHEDGKPKILDKRPPKIDVQYLPANTNIQFAVTIYHHELEMGLGSEDGNGILTLIDTIVSRLGVSAEYTDHSLFTYLLGRAILTGDIGLVGVDPTDMGELGVRLRALESDFTLPTKKYNREGKLTSAAVESVYTLMTPLGRARYDKELSNAFHVELADNRSHMITVNRFSDIDWDYLRNLYEDSTMVVPFTEAELTFLDATVAAVTDSEFWQVYERPDLADDFINGQQHSRTTFLTKRGYWHTSAFANAVVLVDQSVLGKPPATLQYKVTSVQMYANGQVGVVIDPNFSSATFFSTTTRWVQDEAATAEGIAVLDGGIAFPVGKTKVTATIVVGGATYTATVKSDVAPGAAVTFTKA